MFKMDSRLNGNDKIKSGFTLIELAIVLVVIGLIVGGVMVGRDLIEGAGIRATVSKIDAYKSAYQTFRLKYNCIPGDCSTATQFGLIGYNSNAGWANGDGDGLIYSYMDGTTTGPPINAASSLKLGESWSSLGHLSGAGLIDRFFTNGMATTTSNIPTARAFMFFTSLRPSAPPVGYIAADRSTYLYISTYPTNVQNFQNAFPVFSPSQALQIDSKMDDGLPMSGSVRASYVAFDCPGISSAWRQGPCFNIPYTKTFGAAISAPQGNGAPIDNTVTPAVYNLNAVVTSGFELFSRTSLHITVD